MLTNHFRYSLKYRGISVDDVTEDDIFAMAKHYDLQRVVLKQMLRSMAYTCAKMSCMWIHPEDHTLHAKHFISEEIQGIYKDDYYGRHMTVIRDRALFY